MKTASLIRPGLFFPLFMLLALISQDVFASSWFVSPQIGTQGWSAQLGYRGDDKFGVRAAWNQYAFDKAFTVNSVKYDSRVHLKTIGLLADYYPLDNGFHLTAGLYRNDNQASGSGYIDRELSATIGGKTYRVDGRTLGKTSASVKYAPIAPYIGVGYHSVTKKGFGVDADLGVLYQGNARVDIGVPESLRNINIASVKTAVEQQKDDIESEANKYRWYPVVSIGISYTF